jgi:hypothetical protein
MLIGLRVAWLSYVHKSRFTGVRLWQTQFLHMIWNLVVLNPSLLNHYSTHSTMMVEQDRSDQNPIGSWEWTWPVLMQCWVVVLQVVPLVLLLSCRVSDLLLELTTIFLQFTELYQCWMGGLKQILILHVKGPCCFLSSLSANFFLL